MINSDVLNRKLLKYYDKVNPVTDYIFKCQKIHNKMVYQYFYFDFSNKISDINIEQYSKKLISNDYYSHPNFM